MHSCDHLVPLVLSIVLWVICPTREIIVSILSSSDIPTLVYLLVFHRLMRKHLDILANMMSGCITFSEALCLA
jgi:hypothetical protein